MIRGKPIPGFMVQSMREAGQTLKPWWHVYLDNFCVGQRVARENHEDIEQGNILHSSAEAAWQRAGIISSKKKRVVEANEVEELGALVNGSGKTLGISGTRLFKLLLTTFYVIGEPLLSRKSLQILAGRWVHALQFRRAGMTTLEHVWQFISKKKVGSKVSYQVRRELLQLCCLAPLLNTSLDASIAKVITASDASERAGAVGIARELRTEGIDFGRAMKLAPQEPGNAPILVISLFNGIGGCYRCYDIIGIQPAGMIAVECHGPANRIVSRRWPGAKLVKDVKLVDEEMVRGWALEFPEVLEVHLWAGFPCTDLSAVRAGRKGLQGPASGLFYEIPRITSLIKSKFGAHVVFKRTVENVASMDRDACTEISWELGTLPYMVDSADCSLMRRPRLCWTTETLEESVTGLAVTQESHWKRLWTEAPAVGSAAWIEDGWSWPGENEGTLLPTAMKSIPRYAPPMKPAGLARCDKATRDRWQADSFRFPPYQYGASFVFHKDHKWRLVSASERELIMGYGFNHTQLAYSASEIKRDPIAYEDERASLLGDSFSIHSFSIVAAAMCRRWLPRVSFQHLCDRMGLAPGYRAPIRLKATISRSLQYGTLGLNWSPHVDVESINRELLARVNHTGSDVRIASGQIMNPKAYPRQSVCASWFKWEHLFRRIWKTADHINTLEMRAILLALRYHITHLHACNMRVFHITDSYICMSIVGKGRTGSTKLRWTLKQISSLLLAFNLYLILGHVESSENPTDDATRSL